MALALRLKDLKLFVLKRAGNEIVIARLQGQSYALDAASLPPALRWLNDLQDGMAHALTPGQMLTVELTGRPVATPELF